MRFLLRDPTSAWAKGCAVFGEAHGICLPCLKRAPSLLKACKNAGNNHKCRDQSEHMCTLTADAAAELLTNLHDPQLENLLRDFKCMKPQIESRKSLQYFCTDCQCFKAKSQNFKHYNESNKRWDVMCAGCGSNYILNTTACSVMHCPNCSLVGLDMLSHSRGR